MQHTIDKTYSIACRRPIGALCGPRLSSSTYCMDGGVRELMRGREGETEAPEPQKRGGQRTPAQFTGFNQTSLKYGAAELGTVCS